MEKYNTVVEQQWRHTEGSKHDFRSKQSTGWCVLQHCVQIGGPKYEVDTEGTKVVIQPSEYNKAAGEHGT